MFVAPQPLIKTSDATSWQEFRLNAESAAVRAVLSKIISADPRLSQDPGLSIRGEIVLAEVLNNIVEHAYRLAGGQILLRLRHGAAGLHCEVLDRGCEMPSGALPCSTDPKISSAVTELAEGGYGWNLIHTLTQDLAYTRHLGTNQLSFLLPYAEQTDPS